METWRSRKYSVDNYLDRHTFTRGFLSLGNVSRQVGSWMFVHHSGSSHADTDRRQGYFSFMTERVQASMILTYDVNVD